MVIPADLTLEVLLEAEEVVKAEDEIRTRILAGERAGDLYRGSAVDGSAAGVVPVWPPV